MDGRKPLPQKHSNKSNVFKAKFAQNISSAGDTIFRINLVRVYLTFFSYDGVANGYYYYQMVNLELYHLIYMY